MKKTFIIISFLSIVFLFYQGYQPIDLTEKVPLVDSLLIDAYMPEDLYINEQQIYVDEKLDWMKDMHQFVPVINSNNFMSLNVNSYNTETYVQLDMDVHGSLYLNEDGNYVVMLTITKPYSFQIGENTTIPSDYVFIDYTSFFEVKYSSFKSYLSFDEETEYFVNWFGYNGNPYIQLPSNSYSQYFKYPKLVYTMYFEFEKDPMIDTDYFEFSMTVVETITQKNTIMLGFNQFIGEQYTNYYATAYRVAYKEE